MSGYSSYIICGTPRSGSTMLCEMLAATGVAGRPNSYFREQDIAYWAERWGVDLCRGSDSAEFDKRYLSAMLAEGRNGTAMFGLRIMWGSVAEAVRRLSRLYGGGGDVTELFGQAFGPVRYIHLSRADKVAQAISLLRAEQSGLWHLASDGSVFEGAEAPQPPHYDGARIAELVGEMEADDAAWAQFFAVRSIEPLRVTYETIASEPNKALESVLSALGQDPGIAKAIQVGTAKMAGEASQQWAERFRNQQMR